MEKNNKYWFFLKSHIFVNIKLNVMFLQCFCFVPKMFCFFLTSPLLPNAAISKNKG